MSDNEVVVQFKAVVADFLDKLGQAHKGTADTAEKITSSVHGIGAGFEKLMSTIGALSAVLAGGAMFKEAISETINWTGEVVNLAKKVGVTTEAASGLALALHHVGMSSDEYSGMVNKLTKQMRANQGAFDQMGIATKDSSGEWRNSQDVMLDVIEKLNGMKKGTDLNVASQAIFGGRVGDINKLLKLNMDLIEEETRKAEKLNLIVGPDGAAQAREYKEAMADLSADMIGFSVGVGSALIPVLSKLAENLATVLMPVVKVVGTIFAALGDVFGVLVDCIGDLWTSITGAIKEAFEPLADLFGGDLFTGANVLKVVLGTIETVIVGITLAVKMLVTVAVTAFENMVTSAMAFGKAIKAVFTGDFQGAVAAAKDANDKIEANNLKAMNKIVADSLAANKKIEAIWGDKPEPKKSKEDTGKTVGGNDFKPGKKPESHMASYQEELDAQKDAIMELSNFKKVMGKKAEADYWTGVLEELDKGDVDYKAVQSKKVAAEKAMYDERRALAKKDSDENRAMDKADLNEELAIAKDGFTTRRTLIQEEVDAGRMSKAESLRQLMEIKAQELAVEKAAINQEMLDESLSASQIQALRIKRDSTERKAMDDIATYKRQLALKENLLWVQLGQTIQSSLGNALTSIITRTQTFTQALQGLFKSVTDSAVKMFIDMGIEQAKQFIMRKVLGKEAAASDITAGAGAYAVNAMQSVAAIPLYGWAMAPGVGAEAFATGMGYMGSIASAAQGWDIPAGLNPMAQLHEREMVLPAEHADTIRSMGKGGGGAQIHLNISTMDARSFKRALSDNKGGLVDVLHEAARNGWVSR